MTKLSAPVDREGFKVPVFVKKRRSYDKRFSSYFLPLLNTLIIIESAFFVGQVTCVTWPTKKAQFDFIRLLQRQRYKYGSIHTTNTSRKV